MTHPSRHLLGSKPHRYVSALDTDIRRAFRRWRLLKRLRGCHDPLAAHQGDVRGVEARLRGMLHEQREKAAAVAQAG